MYKFVPNMYTLVSSRSLNSYVPVNTDKYIFYSKASMRLIYNKKHRSLGVPFEIQPKEVIGQNLCEKLSAWLGVKWKICFDLLVNKKHSFEATLIITSVFMTIFITPCVNSRKILIRDARVDSLALKMKFTF